MITRLLYKAILAAMVVVPSVCAAKNNLDKYHEEITELSIDENLAGPEIPRRIVNLAKGSMTQLANSMSKAGLHTDLSEREGLVLMVTIPAAELFAANDSLLLPSAAKILTEIGRPLRTPDKYKMLVAVHSDDTGSEEYLNSLTRSRADAIVEWIARQGIPVDAVIPYGVGFDEPLSTEASREARAANRRVEIYYVPGPVMIEQLKAGRQ